MPDVMEELIMSMMMGETIAVGIGSNEQVEALQVAASLVNCIALTGLKVERRDGVWRVEGVTHRFGIL